jgi:hypothetical protein
VNVEFTPNRVTIKSTDETKNGTVNATNSEWAMITQQSSIIEVNAVKTTEGGENVSGIYGIYMKVTPRAGYKFVGWTVYLPDGRKLDWLAVDPDPTEFATDLDGILEIGNNGIKYLTNISNPASPEYDPEKPQEICFTPQYNGLILMAAFEILTPTIVIDAIQAYPIYNGEQQDLLIKATTQDAWAYIQYGYKDEKTGEVDWDKWNGKIPTRTDVVSFDGSAATTIVDTIYYRATHRTGRYPNKEDDYDKMRPTSVLEPNVTDVRILPMPISFNRSAITTPTAAATDASENLQKEWLHDQLTDGTFVLPSSGADVDGYGGYQSQFAEGKRAKTRVITGMAEWKKATDGVFVDDPIQEPIVIHESFVITGYWSKYFNDGKKNTMSKGNFQAYGNYAGYLYLVDAFEIIDNVARIVWKSLRSPSNTDTNDDLIEGDLAYKVHATTLAVIDFPIRKQEMLDKHDFVWEAYTERSRKYTYTFVGWSEKEQVWSEYTQDDITLPMLDGKYVPDSKWGIDGDKYTPADNTQIAKRGSVTYYAIYTRTLRTYTVIFNCYEQVGENIEYIEFYKAERKYGQMFYISELPEMSSVHTDIRLRGYRYIFRRWPVTESFVVTRDYNFNATQSGYDVYPDFSHTA